MDRPSEDIIRTMQEDARDRLYSKLELIEETYEANKSAIAARASGSEYWCTGTMKLTSVVINTGIKIENLEFKDFPEVLKFKGTSWGIGIGYGTSFGTGVFYRPPRQLDGMKVKIELAFIVTVGGVIQASFWDDWQLIGAMNFLGAGAGLGVFYGDGKFSKD